MSYCFWLIIIALTGRLSSSMKDLFQNCFYEKRFETALNGHNDIHDQWTSDFDCFHRCLMTHSHTCRSFEHWRRNDSELCVLSSASITNDPPSMLHSPVIDYYEINCQSNDGETIEIERSECSKTELSVWIKLNQVEKRSIFLGNESCSAVWSNATHLRFRTDIGHCALMFTENSVVGKLIWRRNNGNLFERFFNCSIELLEQFHLSTRTINSTTIYPYLFTKHVSNEQDLDENQKLQIEWIWNNRIHACSSLCLVPLHAKLRVTFENFSNTLKYFFIESCDFMAVYPYASYAPSSRLIEKGCSVDRASIIFEQEFKPYPKFAILFDIFHKIKEPINFEVQCQIQHRREPTIIDCSWKSSHIEGRSSKTDKQVDHLYRSGPIQVTRHTDPKVVRDEITSKSSIILRSNRIFFLLLIGKFILHQNQ